MADQGIGKSKLRLYCTKNKALLAGINQLRTDLSIALLLIFLCKKVAQNKVQ